MTIQTVELISPDALKWLMHLEIMQIIRLSPPVVKEEVTAPKSIADLYGTLNWGVTVEGVESQLTSLRDEWERDIY